MIYLDANIFVYLICYGRETGEHARAKEAMNAVLKSHEPLVTASLTWDELTHASARLFGREIAKSHGEWFLRFPHLSFAPVTQITLRGAQALFAEGLKPRDAIHAACALENHCTKIISNDPHFDKVKGLKRVPI